MVGGHLDGNHEERIIGYSHNKKVAYSFASYYQIFSSDNGATWTTRTYYEFGIIATASDSPDSISILEITGTHNGKSAGIHGSSGHEIVYQKGTGANSGIYHSAIYSSEASGKRYGGVVTGRYVLADNTVIETSYTTDSNLPVGWTDFDNVKIYINDRDDWSHAVGGTSFNVDFGQPFNVRVDGLNPDIYYDIIFYYWVDYNTASTRYLKYTLASKLNGSLYDNTNVSVTIPLSIISGIEPTATRKTFYIQIERYGGEYNDYTKDVFQLLYPMTKSFVNGLYANVPDSLVPTVSISASEHSQGLPSGLTFFVTKRSTAEVRINASGQYGATIKSISSMFEGTKYTGSSFVTNTFGSTGNYIVTTTVTDSRGRSANASYTLVVKNWSEPVLTKCFGYRCAALDDPTEYADGAFVCVKATGSVSPVDNENTLTCTVSYKAQGDQYSSTVTIQVSGYVLNQDYAIFPANIGADYDVTVVLADRFTQTAYICARVPATGALIHIKRNKRGMGVFRRAPANQDGLYVSGLSDITGNFKVHGLIEAEGTVTAQTDLTTVHGLALQQYNTATAAASNEYIPIMSFATPDGFMTLCAHPEDGTMAVVNYNSTSHTATVTTL